MRNLALVPLLALLLLITACSQAEDAVEDTVDASLDAVFPNAAASAEDAGTFAFEMRIEFESPGYDDLPLFGDGYTMHVEGVQDLERDAIRTTTEAPFLSIEAILLDGRAYTGMRNAISGDLFWTELPAFDDAMLEDAWADPLTNALNGGLFGNASAADTIAALKLVATEVEDLGRDDINGIDARHYRAHVTGDDPNAGDLFLAANGRITIDLWLDAEGRPVRIIQEMKTTGDLAEGQTTIRTEADYFDFGEPVEIEAPPASEILSEAEFFEAVFDFGEFEDDLFGEDFGFELPPTLDEIDPPCYGDDEEIDACRYASDELKATYSDPAACDGDERRLCILPVGNVPVWQLEQMQAYFLDQYGLPVVVLPPIDATDDLGTEASPGHWQVGYYEWENLVTLKHHQQLQAGARIIGITPLDLYVEAPGGWTFGTKSYSLPGGEGVGEGLYGMVSTFRFNPVTLGDAPDDELWFERTRKMTTKYAGILHWGLEEDQMNEEAAMYRHLYSISAMDTVSGHLPVEAGTEPAVTPYPVSPPVAEGAPCTTTELWRCLEPDPAVAARWDDPSACDEGEHRICIVALGAVPEWQIEATVAQIEGYGIDTRVLPPVAVPLDAFSYDDTAFSVSVIRKPIYEYFDLDTSYEISFLYLSPADVRNSPSHEFAFSSSWEDTVSLVDRYALVSTFRLDPRTYGQPADDTLLASRLEVLVARAAGHISFHLEVDGDPTSPMYEGLYSLEALDAMTPNLPGTH